MTAFWAAYGSTIMVGGLLLAVVIGILVQLVRAKRAGSPWAADADARTAPVRRHATVAGLLLSPDTLF